MPLEILAVDGQYRGQAAIPDSQILWPI